MMRVHCNFPPMAAPSTSKISHDRPGSTVDALAEDPFDRLTRMASRLLGAPVALVAFAEDGHFKLRSQLGLGLGGRDLPASLCAAAAEGGEPLLIADAKADPRFARDPAVTGPPFLRAFGGVPLRRPGGEIAGVFCVLDRSARPFTPDQIKTLKYLAAIAEDEIAKGGSAAPASHPLSPAHAPEAPDVAEMNRLFTSQDTPVFVHESIEAGMNSIVTDVNDAACDLLGYPRPSLIGGTLVELFFQSHPEWLSEIDQMLATHCDVVFKIDLRSALGIAIPVEVNTRLLGPDAPASAYSVVGRLAEDRHEIPQHHDGDGPPLAERGAGMLCRFKPDGTLTYVNDAFCEHYGEERKHLVGFIFRPPTLEEDRAIAARTLGGLTASNPQATCEYRVIGGDGRAGWQRWTYTGFFDEADARVLEYQALGNGFSPAQPEVEESAEETGEPEMTAEIAVDEEPLAQAEADSPSEMESTAEASVQPKEAPPQEAALPDEVVAHQEVAPAHEAATPPQVAVQPEPAPAPHPAAVAVAEPLVEVVPEPAAGAEGGQAMPPEVHPHAVVEHAEPAAFAVHAPLPAPEPHTEVTAQPFVEAIAETLPVESSLAAAPVTEEVGSAKDAPVEHPNPPVPASVSAAKAESETPSEAEPEDEAQESGEAPTPAATGALAALSILDSIDDGVFVASVAEERVVYLNHGAELLVGLPAKYFASAPEVWREIFHPDDLPALRRALQTVLADGQSDFAGRLLRPGGEYVWVQGRARLVHDASGDPEGDRIEGVLRDVTERRRAEEALRASEAKFRDMALNTPGVVFQWNEREDGHSGFTYISPRLQEIFAIPNDESYTFVERIHSTDREGWRQALAAARLNPGPWSFEGRLICPDGRVRWMQCAAKPVRYSPGDLLFNGVILDNTERKRTENELRASEERFRLVLQASNDGIWDWDLTSKRIYFSPRWKEMLGYQATELPDHPRTYYRLLVREDRPVARAAFRAHLKRNEPCVFNARLRHRDGSVRWILCRGNAQLDHDGHAVRMVGIHTDITTSKRAEEALRTAKDAAEAADRSKAEFLAVMSHEIRTPMNGILGFTDLLLGGKLDPEPLEYAQTIKTSGDALMTLLNDILDLSKLEAGGMELENRSFDLVPFLDGIVTEHKERAREKALNVVLAIDPAAPDAVVADRSKLRQIVGNLVNNAIKFTAQGEVRLEIILAGRETPAAAEQPLFSLEFRVSDTGIGIQPERLDRLFKPFSQADSSSTRRYGGMGLGLVIGQRLCALMGGVIKARSTVGKGSVFTFTLALPGEKHEPVAAEAGASDTHFLFEHASGPRVLVAEDNPVNQKLIRAMLKRLGLVADYALNGLDVLQLVIDRPLYDIVFMDVHMPAMDGLMTTQRLREMERERTDGRRSYIIALTADAMPGDRERCLEAGVDDYLTKPFTQLEVAAALERARAPLVG